MRRLLFALFALVIMASTTVTPSHAADRIVAVVNDQVITLSQLQARTRLNLRQVGLANATAQQQEAVSKRSLSNLIDEELQRQYAEKSGVTLTKAETETSIANVKQAMGDEVWKTFTAGGLEQAAKDKILAETRWQILIERNIRPRVQVSTAEADRLIAELAKGREIQEREISVIQMEPGTTPEDDKAKLDKLTELKQKVAAGEPFAELARAHSDDKSAVNGGKLGWFTTGELNPQLEQSLDSLQPGQTSEPIRTPTGWYLVRLDNTRSGTPVTIDPQTQLELFLLATPTPEGKTAYRDLEKSFDTTTARLKTRDNVTSYFSTSGFAESFPASTALGWVTQTDLDPILAKAIGNSHSGSWTGTVTVNGNSARLYLANTRQIMPEKLNQYREKVLSNLFGNRVELEARRFMQNLRQRAFLDIRL